MTEAEIKRLIERYNEQQVDLNYWITFGLAATEELHNRGMSYRDIQQLGVEPNQQARMG